ncbi:MAG: hypothetical protein D6742_12680, partial [Cyanobacteria bacterium J069]
MVSIANRVATDRVAIDRVASPESTDRQPRSTGDRPSRLSRPVRRQRVTAPPALPEAGETSYRAASLGEPLAVDVAAARVDSFDLPPSEFSAALEPGHLLPPDLPGSPVESVFATASTPPSASNWKLLDTAAPAFEALLPEVMPSSLSLREPAVQASAAGDRPDPLPVERQLDSQTWRVASNPLAMLGDLTAPPMRRSPVSQLPLPADSPAGSPPNLPAPVPFPG